VYDISMHVWLFTPYIMDMPKTLYTNSCIYIQTHAILSMYVWNTRQYTTHTLIYETDPETTAVHRQAATAVAAEAGRVRRAAVSCEVVAAGVSVGSVVVVVAVQFVVV